MTFHIIAGIAKGVRLPKLPDRRCTFLLRVAKSYMDGSRDDDLLAHEIGLVHVYENQSSVCTARFQLTTREVEAQMILTSTLGGGQRIRYVWRLV